MRFNNNDLLDSRDWDLEVSFFVRNTEIVFCGVITPAGFEDKEPDFIKRDFFSVERGVSRGGLTGNSGSLYSDIDCISYSL
jgi:hypothetical protein